MAKLPVITNAMAINTGRAPVRGAAVRVDVFFDAATPEAKISLTDVMQNGNFDTIQCVYIDNSLNPATVIITIPGIQQRLIVNGYSQSLEPLYVSDSACSAPISLYSASKNIPGFPVSLWFSNVPQPFYQKTGLINNVHNAIVTLPIGNTGGHSYTYTLDMSNSMLLYGIADWCSIFIDNSGGFQHLYVNDLSVGATVGVVNPYTIAQFSTLGVGSNLYSFSAFDLACNAAQSNFSYGYDVPLLMRAQKGDTYFNSVAQTGQYTAVTSQALGAGGSFTLYPNFMRKRITFFGTAAFTCIFNGQNYASAADAAGRQFITLDVTSTSGIFSAVPPLPGITVGTAIAQTINIRDKF